jgi:D-amino-acid dehydrogenase
VQKTISVCDAVVVGGGVVGFGAAYRLARAGLRVTVIDQEHEGRATDAGAGIVFPAPHVGPGTGLYPLVFDAVRYYPILLAQLEEDGETETGYEVVGALQVALDEEEEDRLPAIMKAMREGRSAGLRNVGETSWLQAREARELFPTLTDIRGAIYLSEAARVDGRLLRGSLKRAAQRRGTEVIHGLASLRTEGDRAIRVEVDGRIVPADRIIVAAGAWSAAVCKPLRLQIPVYPQRGQILHLDLPGRETSRWPIVLGFRSHYILTFPKERVVAGATREDDSGDDPRVTAGGAREILNEALRVAPGLADATLREIRVGLRPASRDGKPILGRAPEVENVYLSTGHGRTGLLLGPYSGALVADQLLGEPEPTYLPSFSAGRFLTDRRHA